MTSAAYIAKSCSRLDELARGIKEVKQTQNTVLTAINDLSDKLNDIDTSNPGWKGCTSSLALIPIGKGISTSDLCSDQPVLEYGYVNWNSSHNVLIHQLWRKVAVYTEYCGRRERGIAHDRCGACITPSSRNTQEYNTINVQQRFPEFGLYVNVSNPQIAAEILYISAIHVTEEDSKNNNKCGVLVARFLQEAKNDMHTRGSFEEKYGLRWVDQKKPKSSLVKSR